MYIKNEQKRLSFMTLKLVTFTRLYTNLVMLLVARWWLCSPHNHEATAHRCPLPRLSLHSLRRSHKLIRGHVLPRPLEPFSLFLLSFHPVRPKTSCREICLKEKNRELNFKIARPFVIYKKHIKTHKIFFRILSVQKNILLKNYVYIYKDYRICYICKWVNSGLYLHRCSPSSVT